MTLSPLNQRIINDLNTKNLSVAASTPLKTSSPHPNSSNFSFGLLTAEQQDAFRNFSSQNPYLNSSNNLTIQDALRNNVQDEFVKSTAIDNIKEKNSKAQNKKTGLNTVAKVALGVGAAAVALAVASRKGVFVGLKGRIAFNKANKAMEKVDGTITEVQGKILKYCNSGNQKVFDENGNLKYLFSEATVAKNPFDHFYKRARSRIPARVLKEYAPDGETLLRKTEFDPISFKPIRISSYVGNSADVINIDGKGRTRFFENMTHNDKGTIFIQNAIYFDHGKPVLYSSGNRVERNIQLADRMFSFHHGEAFDYADHVVKGSNGKTYSLNLFKIDPETGKFHRKESPAFRIAYDQRYGLGVYEASPKADLPLKLRIQERILDRLAMFLLHHENFLLKLIEKESLKYN